MPFVIVSLYEITPRTEFDPTHVINVLRDAFEDLTIVSDDALADRLNVAKRVLSPDKEAEAFVLQEMERDKRIQGPAIAFNMTIGPIPVRGVVKRQLLSFVFDEPLPDECITALCLVIQSVHHLGNRLPIEIGNI